jgi:hypothetical protein
VVRLSFVVIFLLFFWWRLWFAYAVIQSYTSRDFEVPVRCVLSLLLLILIPTPARRLKLARVYANVTQSKP